MPTYDEGSAAARQSADAAGAWASEVLGVTAEEHVSLRDDGTIRRGVLVSWLPPAGDRPVRGFRVFHREVDAPRWDASCDAGPDARSALVLDRFRVGATYEVAVVPVGASCCALRPRDAARTRATVRIVGDVVPLAPPTGLSAVQLGERTLVRWTPGRGAGVPLYEVRCGADRFDLAEVVGRTTLPELAIPDLPPLAHVGGAPTLTVHVAAVGPSGFVGSPAHLAGVSPSWGASADVGPARHSAPGWSGTKTDCAADAGELVIDAGATTATYVTVGLDGLAEREWKLYVVTLARRENRVLTPRLAQFAPASYWGRRRSAFGGDVEAYPQDPVPRRPPLAPESAFGTPNEMAGYRPNSFLEERPSGQAVLTPNEARFTANSDAGRSATANAGVVSTAGTGYAVEVSFSADGSTWSAWEAYRPQTRTFRHVRARVTLSQPAPAMRLVIEELAIYLVRTTAAALSDVVAQGVWAEAEKPSGTVDGVNDAFTLAHTPKGPPMLFKSGLLQQQGVGLDYTISGTTLTYAPGSVPGPADWHLIWYRY